MSYDHWVFFGFSCVVATEKFEEIDARVLVDKIKARVAEMDDLIKHGHGAEVLEMFDCSHTDEV